MIFFAAKKLLWWTVYDIDQEIFARNYDRRDEAGIT